MSASIFTSARLARRGHDAFGARAAMKPRAAACASIAATLLGVGAVRVCAAEIDGRRSFSFAGATRQFYLFAPARACVAASPAPLLILHHGTGDDGSGLIAAWKRLARRERAIVAAPTGT